MYLNISVNRGMDRVKIPSCEMEFSITVCSRNAMCFTFGSLCLTANDILSLAVKIHGSNIFDCNKLTKPFFDVSHRNRWPKVNPCPMVSAVVVHENPCQIYLFSIASFISFLLNSQKKILSLQFKSRIFSFGTIGVTPSSQHKYDHKFCMQLKVQLNVIWSRIWYKN